MVDTVADALSRFWAGYNFEILVSVGTVAGAMIIVWLVRLAQTLAPACGHAYVGVRRPG